MTRTLIKLHSTLWRRTIKSNPAVLIMGVLIGIYALMGMASVGFLLFFHVQDGRNFIIPAAIGAGMMAYIVLMALLPSGEQQVTARDLATLPLSPQQVRPGLRWLVFLHSRAVLSLLCTAITALVVCLAAASVRATAVTLPFLAVAFFTTIFGGEVMSRILGRGTVGKDRLAAWSAVGFVTLILGFNLLLNGEGTIPLDAVGTVLAWTPLGAAGGAVGASISGQWGIAVAQGAIALGTLGAVLWLWHRGVEQDLREPQIHSVPVKKKRKSASTDSAASIFLPGLRNRGNSQGAAIFSRALRYLRRDSRMVGGLLMLPLVLVFFLYQGGFSAYTGAFILSFFLAGYSSNDFGYDGPGGWLHIVSGVRARTLLVARHAASIAVPFMLIVLYFALLLLLQPNRMLTVTILPAALGYALSGMATSLLLTVYNPFPTSKPGTNPWSDRSGYSSAAMVSGFAFLLLGWVPLLPGIVGLSMGWAQGMAWLTALGGVLAIGVPVAMYLLVIRRCVRKVEQDWPEIYQKVRAWVN